MSTSVADVTPQDGILPWLVCFSAGLFFFYVFFQLNVFDVINQSLRTDFHLDASQLSWMSSSFVWANVLFLLPAGFILDRFPARYVILVAMFFCVLGTFGFAESSSFLWGSLFHAVTGAANAFCFLSCVVLVSRWFPPQRQAFVIGCIVTMAFLGGMMAHTPLAYLRDTYGWRSALLLDSVVGVVIWLWLLCVVRDKAGVITQRLSSESWCSVFRAVLTNRHNWLCGIYTSCLNLPIMVLCALWGASYLQVVHHVAPLQASSIVSLIYAGSMIGCPLLGWLSDREKRRKPLMTLCAVGTLCLLMYMILDVHLSILALSVMFFMVGFLTSAQVLSYPFIAASNPLTHTGLATGLASVIIMGGGGVGQVLFGILMQRHAATTVYTISDFNHAMWIFPVAIVMALCALMWTRETYCE